MRIQVRCVCAGAPWVRMSAHNPNEFAAALVCAECGRQVSLHTECVTTTGGLVGCLACGHPELFTRKSCPPSLGIVVVVVAAVLAPWTYYLSLVGAAIIDFALYRLVPDVVACYVCGAEHRAFGATPRHPRFDRQIEERLRYGPRAVMGRAMRSGGTAGAPEPEH
jgi:hypothetical protein